MTPLQDKLRAALRETADEIPAEAPPLRLSPQPQAGQNWRHTRWRTWAAPLAAAALIIATVAVSLTVAAVTAVGPSGMSWRRTGAVVAASTWPLRRR